MGLGFQEIKDASTYFSTGPVFGQVKRGSGASELVYIGQSMNGPSQSLVYLDSADSVMIVGRRVASNSGMMRFDPLLLDNGEGACHWESDEPSNGIYNGVHAMGEYNRVLGTQTAYFGHANAIFQSYDPVSMLLIDSDPFGNATSFKADAQQNGRASTDNGYWTHATFGSNGMIFFETLGYALKLGAQFRDGTLGSTGGTNYSGVMFAVALTSGGNRLAGDAVDILDQSLQSAAPIDIPIVYNTTAFNQFTRPRIFGEDLYFSKGQFVPDSDSTVTEPKGFLFLQTEKYTVDATPPDAGPPEKAIAMKIVDWNPTGKAGLPNRIHTRERLLSRIKFRAGALDDLNYVGGLNRTFTSTNDLSFYFHPPSNSIRMLSFDATTIVSGGAFHTDNPWVPNRFLQSRVSVTPVVSFVTQPTAADQVEVDSTKTFQSTAYGDLGERIQGTNVDFDLSRVSTEGEAVATTNTNPDPVSLAFKPVDTDSLTVYFNGSPLTEGVEYSAVDLDAGTFQMDGTYVDGTVTADYSYTQLGELDIEDEDVTTTGSPPETVTVEFSPIEPGTLVVTGDVLSSPVVLVENADYDQVDNAAGTFRLTDTQTNGNVQVDYTVARPSTSHGSLLNSSSLSDENGQATTRVKMPNDVLLIGGKDDLRAVVDLA